MAISETLRLFKELACGLTIITCQIGGAGMSLVGIGRALTEDTRPQIVAQNDNHSVSADNNTKERSEDDFNFPWTPTEMILGGSNFILLGRLIHHKYYAKSKPQIK